jgi:hypothetical protein
MVELLTITAKAFFWFLDIGGIVDHHSLNFLNKTKESFIIDGHKLLQYQQTKRKFIKQRW